MSDIKMSGQILLKINSEVCNDKLINVSGNPEFTFFSGRAHGMVSVIPMLNQGFIFIKADDKAAEIINPSKSNGVLNIEGKNIRYAGIYAGIYDRVHYDEEKLMKLFNIIIEETDFAKQCQIIEAGNIDTSKYKIKKEKLFDAVTLYRQSEELVRMIDEIIKCNGRKKISELADIFDYSVRHFYRIFTDNMDISPKLYMRILRCSIVINRMTENPECEINEYMESLGYFDQSHFQHEFKWFTGITPKSFLKKIST